MLHKQGSIRQRDLMDVTMHLMVIGTGGATSFVQCGVQATHSDVHIIPTIGHYGLFVRATRLELGGIYKNESFVLMCTLFLGRIGFLSKTALSQPSQQGKEGLDKNVFTNSSMMLRNCICHGMGLVGDGLTLRRGKIHIGDLGLATNLGFLGGKFLYFVLCPTKNSFVLARNECLGVKNSIYPLINCASNGGTFVLVPDC